MWSRIHIKHLNKHQLNQRNKCYIIKCCSKLFGRFFVVNVKKNGNLYHNFNEYFLFIYLICNIYPKSIKKGENIFFSNKQKKTICMSVYNNFNSFQPVWHIVDEALQIKNWSKPLGFYSQQLFDFWVLYCTFCLFLAQTFPITFMWERSKIAYAGHWPKRQEVNQWNIKCLKTC